MASREESVDVSITAALAKISALEKALAKATKVSVDLSTTAAMGRIRAIDQALAKATSNRTLSFNTTRAQTQIAALNRELDKVTSGRAATGVDLSTVQKGRAAQAAAQQQAVRAAQEAAAKETAAVEKSVSAQVRAEQRKAAEIQAVNQRLAAFQRNQAADTERAAARASAKALADQRTTLSAQLSQVRSLQNVGQQLTFGLTLPIAGAAVAVTRLGFTFEDTLNRIRVLTTPAFRTSQKAVDELRASILRLGPETGRTPTELADGFYQIASAGVSGSVALQTLKAAAQAATIGLGETNVVADIATSVFNAYGSSAGNAFQVTNTLAEAVRVAKGEASEFAPVIGRLLPVAKNLGISFSDVAGSVALLTRNGLSASEATTQLRGLFNSFIKPSVQARKELDRVGLSSTQLLGQLQRGDFAGALGRIRDAFGGDQLGLGRLFRNQQGLNAFLTLTRDLSGTVSVLNDVRAAGKAAADSVSGFDQIKSDPVVQFRIAMSQLQGELIKIGSSLAPAIVGIARLGATLASLFNALPSGARTFVVLALGVAALAGPFLIAYTAVQRLRIAKQQLDLAMGSTGGLDAAGASASRFGQIMGGQVGGVIKFASALGALAAVAGGFQLGKQLADASSGGEKLGAILGIAGTAVGAFIAGSAVGGPVVGGLASAATVAAGAIGFMGERAAAQAKNLNSLRDALIGVTDAEQRVNIITKSLPGQLESLLNKTDKFGQIEFGDLVNANVNFRDFGKVLATGGTALAAFNREASKKVAVEQLKQLNAELAKGPDNFGVLSDEALHTFEVLEKNHVAKLNDDLFKTGVTGPKALSILAAAAEQDMGKVSGALEDPIQKAAKLTELTKGTEDSLTGLDGAATDAEGSLQGFGSSAGGAALSIADLATALNDAVKAANDLNSAKLDAFTGQADTAASFADFFDTVTKNKDVLPILGQQQDVTTEQGRKNARAIKEVTDALAGQIGPHREAALAILQETGSVSAATDAYGTFLTEFSRIGTAAGLSQDQLNLILAATGSDLAGFVDGIRVTGADAAAAAKSAIDGLLGAIPADAAAAVAAISEPTDQVAALANQLSLLPDQKITEVFASVANAENVDTLAEVVQNLPPEKQVAVLAATQGKPELQSLTDLIVDELPDSKVAEAIVNTKGQPEMDSLLTSVFKLPPSRIAAITAQVNGTPQVDALKAKLDGTKGKEVFIKATTTGQPGVDALRGAVNQLNSKTITVTTRFNTIQQGAGLKVIGRNPDGTPIFGRSGMQFGPGGVRKMAGGGVITGMARQPMIVRQRAAQGILWGEPETMGEAYISYARRFRERNRRILSRVASDFGMMIVPKQMARGGMVIERRAAGGVNDATLSRLADAVSARQQSRGDTPLIGEVTVVSQAQTPAAFAVEAVGALGARLAERIADRG